jgi:chemotaxis response regulator CheB
MKTKPIVCVGGSGAQPDMPGSAISSGCIDFILSPEDIAKEIKRIVQAVRKQQI